MSNNPLSNISYTNKDFNSIYVELLDLVKKLTYKWDPTMSNESDPGNILIKLNAIIGDKNNYNIDKNVLENFPETLTQDISARSLYKQLAYKMSWYQAATTDIFFKWCGTDKYTLTDTSGSINIPKFQLVCDANSEFVYTTLDPVTLTKFQPTQSVRAIEGIINTLSFNGQDYIELNNLDHNNRIYFDEHNIAENGLFIYNYGGNDNYYWTMVDNLQVEALGNRFFEFGVDPRKNLCYIEFPEDIDKLIGQGLVIKYIVTNGVEGNVISQILDRFYEDITVTFNGEDVLLNSDVIQIRNMTGTNNGTNPEDTTSAYKNYRKIAGTFHTLVTLRDYINAIYSSGLVSNVQVCDRLNDVQSTYSIVSTTQTIGKSVKQPAQTSDGSYIGFARVGSVYETNPGWKAATYFTYDSASNALTPVSESDYDNNNWQSYFYKVDDVKDDLGAFDLKLYALHTPGNVGTFDEYTSTFDVEPSGGIVEQNIKGYIENERCIQHDFKPILPNIPFMFRNVYPIDIKIIPHYKLDDNQTTELKININKALFSKLNSSNLDFGIEANYDIIYDTILNADERIKVLILDDFIYSTFATYWDGNQFKNIPVSEFNDKNIVIINDTFKTSNGDPITLTETELTELFNSENILNKYLQKPSSDNEYPYIYNLFNVIEKYRDTLNYYQYNNTYFITSSNNYVYKLDDNKLRLYSSKIDRFRLDIISKSVLAGVTPLYKDDNIFDYIVDQDKICLEDSERISTDLVLYPFGYNSNTDGPFIINNNRLTTTDIMASYTLRENENIRFLAPSLRTETTYSNYTKFELILNGTNGIEQDLSLRYNEYMLDSDRYKNKAITLERTTDAGLTYAESETIIDLNDYAHRIAINDESVRAFNDRKVSLYEYDEVNGTNKLIYMGLLSHLLDYTYQVTTTIDNRTIVELKLNEFNNGQAYMNRDSSGKINFYTDPGHNNLITPEEKVLYIDLNSSSVEENNYISYVWDGKDYKKSLYVLERVDVPEKDQILHRPNEPQDDIIYIEDVVGYNNGEYSVTGKLHEIFSRWYTTVGTETQPPQSKLEARTYKTIMDFNDIVMQEWQHKECNVIHRDTIYSIPAKSDYMLQDNEYITFFWKEEDSDDAPYIYKSYNAGTIIKPSFNVQGVTLDQALIPITTLQNSNKIYYSELSNSMYQKIYAMYDYNDLSGTKTIDIRSKNKITIDSDDKRRYYFITNDIIYGNKQADTSKDQYNMKLTRGRYTLNNDEYFIITDADCTSFEIFGAGTLLIFQQLNTDRTEFEELDAEELVPVETVNYEDIAKYGLSVFADKTESLNCRCIVQQQQMFNFSFGDKLTFTLSESAIYDAKTEKKNVTTPALCTNTYTDVSDYVIGYELSSTGEKDYLPSILVNDKESDNYGWSGTALLNISTSYDVPQKISNLQVRDQYERAYSKRSITIGNNDPISPDICYETTNDNPLYVLSSIMLDKVGGHNIDITYVDSYGRRTAPYVYVYKQNSSLINKEGVSFNSDNTYILDLINIAGSVKTGRFTFDKPAILTNNKEFNMLLPIHNVCMDTTFKIYFGNTVQKAVNSNKNVNVGYGRGTYYFDTSVLNDNTINSITIEWTAAGSKIIDTDQIIIEPLFKYQKNESFEKTYGINFDAIKERVASLDVNGIFNYVYNIPQNELIEDPLLAKTFFNENHIFNKFTLPMADLYMSNNTQSKISLINNR